MSWLLMLEVLAAAPGNDRLLLGRSDHLLTLVALTLARWDLLVSYLSIQPQRRLG
ncbi:MAG: hypothetical protein MO852_02505 [Candidatus Devosia euplotis]|nr:hypothetical protein [Candidatus Devosia euplotis]